jgi:hypothetical protein
LVIWMTRCRMSSSREVRSAYSLTAWMTRAGNTAITTSRNIRPVKPSCIQRRISDRLPWFAVAVSDPPSAGRPRIAFS